MLNSWHVEADCCCLKCRSSIHTVSGMPDGHHRPSTRLAVGVLLPAARVQTATLHRAVDDGSGVFNTICMACSALKPFFTNAS